MSPARRREPLSDATIGRYWDAQAATFDDWLAGGTDGVSGYPPEELRAWELVWRRVLGPPPRRILDVGTGTGSMSILLASLGYDVVGVDRSEAMLEVARAKAAAAGLGLDLRRAGAEELPFADGEFDAVVAKLVLWTLLEPEAAVAEWRRCTRPGGRVASVDIGYDRLGARDRARLGLVRAAAGRRRHGGGYLVDPGQVAQLPLWRAGSDAHRNVFLRAGLERVLVEDLVGLSILERRRMAPFRRLWPVLGRHLVEGTVPLADPRDPSDPEHMPTEHPDNPQTGSLA